MLYSLWLYQYFFPFHSPFCFFFLSIFYIPRLLFIEQSSISVFQTFSVSLFGLLNGKDHLIFIRSFYQWRHTRHKRSQRQRQGHRQKEGEWAQWFNRNVKLLSFFFLCNFVWWGSLNHQLNAMDDLYCCRVPAVFQQQLNKV